MLGTCICGPLHDTDGIPGLQAKQKPTREFQKQISVGAFVDILPTNLVQWLLVSRMTPQLPDPWLKWLALPPSAVAETDLLGLDAARDKTATREKQTRL